MFALNVFESKWEKQFENSFPVNRVDEKKELSVFSMQPISQQSFHLILIEKLFGTKNFLRCKRNSTNASLWFVIDIVHYIDIDSLSLSLCGRTKIYFYFNQLNRI